MSAFDLLQTQNLAATIGLMVLLLPSLAAFIAAASAPTAIATNLCVLVAQPAAFTGKIVRFRARVLTDWHHGTALVDSGCQHGIQLSSTDAVPSHESRAFHEALGTPLDLGTDKTVTATFTGQFSFRSGKGQDGFDNSLKFDAQRIEGIEVYPFKFNAQPVEGSPVHPNKRR